MKNLREYPISPAARAAILLFSACILLLAQTGSAGKSGDPWPRSYTNGDATLVLYQPQIDSWKDFEKVEGRFAFALTPAKGRPAVYGAATIQADTVVNTEARTVALSNVVIGGAQYPAAKDDAEASTWGTITANLIPVPVSTMSLDRALAYLEATDVKTRQSDVSLDPPPILVTNYPSVLMIIDGEPVPLDIEGTNLQKVLNTNWDLFFHKKEERYYLRNDKTWLSAKNLTDSWKVETKLPGDFAKLPGTEQYKEIKETAKSPQKPARAVLILVVNKPTELIVTNGDAALQPIAGTDLMWVANTESDIFFSQSDKSYYFLTSGRWFRSPELRSGTWEAATASLPASFKSIPETHPRAHVLASVPGTRQADEAVLAASIPQVATLDRSTAKATVQYIGGEPQFEQIAGTNVWYAKNTPNDVLKLDDRYYLCLEGAWFVSQAATGPWSLADTVPPEVYAIPATSPKYNVTYVNVESSTPTDVTYGYTSGYTGVYIGFGVAMWGTGYYYPPYYGYGYYPYPVYWPAAYYTYGAGVWYNSATGVYGRGGGVYGPYGGYGRAAAYNPATGAYAWGQRAYGPYGAAASGGFYNPSTGTWGARAQASNGYQSWGTSVIGRGDQAVRTASYADSRGAVGAAKGTGGGAAIGAVGSGGNRGFVAKSGSGDVYAGKNGNIYKRDSSGGWSQYNKGSWQGVDRPSPGSISRDQARGNAQPRSGQLSAGDFQGLSRDASARNRGNLNTNRMATPRQSMGGGGGWAARPGGGGGMRRRR